MIDEQQPMQIGLFPLDMKCHTPQQLQQQLLQQQQQQTNGNERMLTTAMQQQQLQQQSAMNCNASKGIDGIAATAITKTATSEASAAAATTTAMAATTAATNVNGNRNNHSNILNNRNNTNCNNNKTTSNQQSIAGGPGPPHVTAAPTITAMTAVASAEATTAVAATNNSNAPTSVSGRVTLGECAGNALNAVAANSNNNNNFSGNIALCLAGGVAAMQQQQQQQHTQHALSLQQHTLLQHHLQQLQLHPPTSLLQQQQQQQPPLQQHAPHQQQPHLLQHHPHQQQHLQQQQHHQHLHQPTAILHHQQQLSVSRSSSSSNSSTSAAGDALNATAMVQCGQCCQPICDRYIMRVMDASYHESCLKCSTCALHLVHSCFARDGKLYCRIDYERLFIRNRCLGCGHKIGSEELVMRTLENVFHLKCFACVVCGALLKKGEQYVVKQGQLFCRFDYEKEVEMLQGYDFYCDDLFPPKLDGRRGPKRPRTILNTQQRRAFKASFEVSPKPCRKVRENLAKETGLSLRIVQVWFQNQRAKVKKIQKKAKQEHVKGASETDSQESDSSLAKIKDEAHSDNDNESLLESPYSSSCGASGGGGSGGSNSDGVAKLRLVKDEHENVPFNCMETNKENCNKTNEPILNTILGLSYATFQQLMGPFSQSPMINPIDRLYSMQNSYFRPEEMGYGECGGKELLDN